MNSISICYLSIGYWTRSGAFSSNRILTQLDLSEVSLAFSAKDAAGVEDKK